MKMEKNMGKNIATKMKNKIRNKGQGVMEYLILTSLVGIFCLIAVKQFGEVIKTRINRMKTHISRNIKVS